MARSIFSSGVALILVFGFLAAGDPARAAKEGQVVYAQSNFYVYKGTVSVINYKTGTMYPVGTRVRVEDVDSDEIERKIVKTGFELEFVGHSSVDVPLATSFDKLFASSDPKSKLNRLSKKEHKLVLAASVEPGMTKDAVLLAMGQPPPHRTPTTNRDVWVYWKNRTGKLEVHFEDGVVTKVAAPEKKDSGPSLFSKIGDAFGGDDEPEALEQFFATANIHHLKEKVSWVNYQRGPIIPFNTRIEVLDKDDDAIDLRVAGTEQTLTFENDHRSGSDTWQLFLKMFSKDDQHAKLDGMSSRDRKAVLAAEVKIGMSKEAVLMALGPPPPHRTASLAASTWTYWKTRTAKMKVRFDDDDRVAAIK